MPGFANDSLGNSIMWSDNVDFSGNVIPSRAITSDGQLLIGSSVAPNIRAGTLASAGGTVAITNGNGTINLEAGGSVPTSFVANSGSASPAAGILNDLGGGSITTSGSGNTLTTVLTGLTNHAVLVGAGTSTITKLGVGTNGQVLLGSTAADPVFGTLTSSDSSITFTTGAGTLSLQVAGGTTTGKTITGQSGGALSPTAGNWNISGATTSSGTSPVVTSGSVSTLTVNVQRSQALASADSTKVGLSNFSSTDFAVDANGFVTLAGTGGAPIQTITGDSGGAEVPSSGNFNILGSGSITTVGSANTETVTLTGLTNHAVLVGAGTTTITKVGPSASTGQILQNNASADPSYSTATYPSTTTVSQILYSSATNTVTGLATANQAVLTTNGSGVPVLTALATNGQIIIGSTAGVPAAATLTQGQNIIITNGSNSITVAQGIIQGSTNIGIAQTAGTTFTVQGANGSALSSTNPAYVTLQSLANPGQLKTYSATANQSYTQANLGNNLFGVTTAVSWAQDLPFYLYAVSNANNGENAIAFMISRVPHATVSPAAGSIAQSGNTNATTQGGFYSLATITATDYAASPCINLGSFRMRYASSLWTVQTINNGDGVGQYNDSVIFNFPISQNGNAANAYCAANGGTAPIWTTQTATYRINRQGWIVYNFDVSNSSPSTNGVGAVTLVMNLPMTYTSNSLSTAQWEFTNATATVVSIGNISVPTSATTATVAHRLWNTAGNGSILQNQDCVTSAKINKMVFAYQASLA